MIRIKLQKMRVASTHEFATVSYAQLANQIVNDVANDMRQKGVDKQTCDDHPTHTSTVILKAVGATNELIRVEKRSFCCQEFEDSIQIIVKK